MEMVDPWERCYGCFAETSDFSLQLCPRCEEEGDLPWEAMAAVFEFFGPAASLVKKLKYHHMPYLALDMASCLVAQFCRLEWPRPDIVTSVPISWSRYLARGYNQSALLAQQLAFTLGVPYKELLGRYSGDLSQAHLSQEDRLKLNGQRFYLKETQAYYGKTLLIIDDVVTTGTTLKKCAELLRSVAPCHLYALLFCHAPRWFPRSTPKREGL